MFFFAWSLVISAVNSARRRRLLASLAKCFDESSERGVPISVVCRHMDFTPLKGLSKCSSESALNKGAPFEDCVIYHSETREILAVPCEDILRTEEWSMLIDPSTPRRQGTQQKIWFVAELAPLPHSSTTGSGSCVELDDGSSSGKLDLDESDTFSIALLSSETLPETSSGGLTVSAGSMSPLLVNQLCKTVAYSRENPWKVLYECSYKDFFEIAFNWSEDALLALNSTATVVNMFTVRVPDNFLTPNAESELLCNAVNSQMASTNSLSVSTPTLSLLELLYRNEFGLGHGTPPGGVDMRTMSVGTLPRYSRSDKSKPLRLSIRYRSCSPLLGTECTPMVNGVACFQPVAAPQRGLPFAYQYVSRMQEPPVAAAVQATQSSRSIKQNGEPRKKTHSPAKSLDSAMSHRTTIRANQSDYGSIPTVDDSTETIDTNEECSSGPPLPYHVKMSLSSSINSTPRMDSDVQCSSFRLEFTEPECDVSYMDCSRSSIGVATHPIDATSGQEIETNHVKIVEKKEKSVEFSIPTAAISPRSPAQHHNSMSSHMHNVDVIEVRPGLLQITEESSDASSSKSFQLTDYGAYCGTRARDISPLPAVLNRRLSVKQLMKGALSRRHLPTPGETMATDIDENANVGTANDNMLMVYTDDNPMLFDRILKQMKTIVSLDEYNVDHILAESLRDPHWVSRKTACLLMASTDGLDDTAWKLLQDYFSHSGKIIFICQNNLLAGLSSCHSLKKQTNLLKMAFGKRHSRSLGKDFENFLKRAVKVLNKSKEINETYHARDFVGGYKYSVHLCKEEDSPMFMYMENTAQQASALFSDTTTDELMSDEGHKLIRDALCRLGINTIENNSNCGSTGYLICAQHQISGIVDRLSFTEPIGDSPKLWFRRETEGSTEENGVENGHTNATVENKDVLTIIVCERNDSNHEFDDQKYFASLKTKSLGKSIISFAKCPSTVSVSHSLSKGLRGYDGIVVVALEQDDIAGRSGGVWSSPKGCPTFSFDFNVPVSSNLGRSIEFAQHILTLSVVQALKSLVGEEFPAKIKWPNDIFYRKKFKLGSVFVESSIVDKYVICVLSGAVNVSNKFPWGCLSDVVESKLTSEQVIAAVMNKFEMLVNLFERKGVEVFLKEYLAHWLHKDDEAYFMRKETHKKEKVVIRGLDHTGHLILQKRKSGDVFCIAEKGFFYDYPNKFIRFVV